MRVTQYSTDCSHHLRTYSLQPAVKMSGALKVKVAREALENHFLGFGVAITGSSCYELNTMTPNAREAFLKSVYSQDGLGLSVGRLSIGASDYSAELYSYDDVENDVELKYFSIERDKAYIIPMIKEILKINPELVLFASPWSPPGWMKTGNSMCGGYMRNEYIECYAEYIISFLKEYEKCGIKIAALTPQNEPETQQNGQMPACIWHPDTEAAFISVLRKKLNENHMDVKIWMYDHNFIGAERVLWSLNTHENLSRDCDGVAFHYYSGAIEDTQMIRENYPQLELHFTEGGPRLYDNYDTDWCKWSMMMAKTLNNGYSSFTGWNLMLDEKGGPNIGPFFCGGLVTLDSQTKELKYSGQYKAFDHISHFMKKGTKIYQTTVEGNNKHMFKYPNMGMAVEACGFENPDSEFVLVLVNPDKVKKQVQYLKNDTWWYIELMPDSVSTVVFED